MESGLYNKWVEKAEASRQKLNLPPKLNEYNLNQENITLMRIEGVFILWAVGITISTLALIVEIVFAKMNQNT